MKKKEKQSALSEAIGKNEVKKGFVPLTDNIYNITKDNRV